MNHRWQERRHKTMKKDKKQKTLQRIMEYMKPYRFLIFASLILAVISVALTLYVPILTGQGVDCLIAKGNVAGNTRNSIRDLISFYASKPCFQKRKRCFQFTLYFFRRSSVMKRLLHKIRLTV